MERESLFSKEIEFFAALLRVGFAFALFAFADQLAQRARMLAVECFNHGILERTLAGIIDHHADPGDGLQHGPVEAEREAQRHNQQTPGYFKKHCRLNNRPAGDCQNVSSTQFNCPWKKSVS